MIAALFVDPRGTYANVPGIDLWPESRDARCYAGPWPVVAHPPCSRWCQLAGIVEKRYGYKRGEDGGCFGSALDAVQRWGGVLEHPAFSMAWPRFGLPRPPASGGWISTPCGGWTCHVEQGLYGHPARKATWLYAHGTIPPPLRWGRAPKGLALVSWCKNHVAATETRPRIGKRAAQATPPEFREVLLAIARSCKVTP